MDIVNDWCVLFSSTSLDALQSVRSSVIEKQHVFFYCAARNYANVSLRKPPRCVNKEFNKNSLIKSLLHHINIDMKMNIPRRFFFKEKKMLANPFAARPKTALAISTSELYQKK